MTSFYPLGKPVDDCTELGFASAYGWVLAQSISLTIPFLLSAMACSQIMPRLSTILGTTIFVLLVVVTLCDIIVFGWIGERFLSVTMQRILTALFPQLRLYVTVSSLIQASVVASSVIVLFALIWFLAGFAAKRWARSPDAVSPLTGVIVLVGLTFAVSFPALRHRERTVAEMRSHSTRHPFCAFHLVGYRGTGIRVNDGSEAVPSRLLGLQLLESVQVIDKRLEALSVDVDAWQQVRKEETPPDIVIIVSESIRHEVIQPSVMPEMSKLVETSSHYRQHFSAGNSTVMGFFGLFTGLESMWFDRPVAKDPPLCRLFRQAGYQLGFFAGDTNWDVFRMGDYIQPDHFDAFEVAEATTLQSDYFAIEQSTKFLNDPNRKSDSPRLAIIYLNGTHCPYKSEPEDQVFQPAAKPSDALPFNPAKVPEIRNRYFNSVRTLDRIIAPLFDRDRVIVFIGDHGESFLEDGCAIHGLRISEYQNMTPMVMHLPHRKPKVVDVRSYHTDILPTLLGYLGIPVDDIEAMDGVDLNAVNDDFLKQRKVSVSNYLDLTSGLTGPWTDSPESPFAFRFMLSFESWQLEMLSAVDSKGYEWTTSNEGEFSGEAKRMEEPVREWLLERFNHDPFEEVLAEQEAFERFGRADSYEIRLAMLRIAESLANPPEYVYDVVAELAGDPDERVRSKAFDMIVRWNRTRE